jgi:hypothetical protein
MNHSHSLLQIPISKSLLSECEIPQIPKHMFKVQLPQTRQRYHELDIFKHQIEQSKAGLHHQPYTLNKRSVLVYKCIFFGLAVLFATLCLITMSMPILKSWGFFSFSSVTLVRSVLISLCSLLSISSFAMGFTLRSEREAVLRCVQKAKATVSRIYARKRVRMGVKRFVAFFGPYRRLALSMRQSYHEVVDKINDKKEESLHLVHRIATAETLSPAQKEELLNQAIEELQDKLLFATHTFRHS